LRMRFLRCCGSQFCIFSQPFPLASQWCFKRSPEYKEKWCDKVHYRPRSSSHRTISLQFPHTLASAPTCIFRPLCIWLWVMSLDARVRACGGIRVTPTTPENRSSGGPFTLSQVWPFIITRCGVWLMVQRTHTHTHTHFHTHIFTHTHTHIGCIDTHSTPNDRVGPEPRVVEICHTTCPSTQNCAS
jgi:hypothetical protein